MVKNDSILETDLVLIHIDHKPVFYARVEKITPDFKPKWWQVKLLFLTVPLQVTIWIIDDNQIRGDDFTMDGTPIRIEKVKVPEEPAKEEIPQSGIDGKEPRKKARVLSLADKNKGTGSQN